MKKFYVLFFIMALLIQLAPAQTQRMVLYEGFSNASCPPCASQNPTNNALILSNFTKVVAIKYQTNWPGTDPMNAQTQTWSGPRVNYYNVTGVPSTRVDGEAISFNQTNINNRYNVPSPFFLEVNHTFNTAQDSVFVEVKIEAAQNYTGTQLVLHTAMVENHIPFTSAPGSNGEKDFYRIMRAMYPNASGTALPGNWTLGEDTTFNFAIKIPSYIYNFDQIAFVVFVQSNANKAVLQAAKTILDLHVAFASNNIPQEPGCYDSFDFELNVVNQGKTTITSFDIEFGITGQTPQVYNWTGSLAYGESTNLTLPTITLPGGNVAVFAEIKNPNGGTNQSLDGTIVQGNIIPVAGYTAIPITEGFSATAFPPAGWTEVSDDNIRWERHTAGGFGNTPGGSARIRFYNSPAGAVDLLYVKGLDLTSVSNPMLSFSLAHARYSASYNDRLIVQLSTDCGNTWNNIYNKSGSDLATVTSFITSTFVPTASQWRTETINLLPYVSYDEVLIRFKAESGYGNNLYIDDINIAEPSSVQNPELIGYLTVFPNPVSQNLNLEFLLHEQTSIVINIYDNIGKLIHSLEYDNLAQGNHHIALDASAWRSGAYFMVMNTESGVNTYKFIKH